MNNFTRFFLVLLRLALGWLILVEGLDKIRSAGWSSAPYLREATGPLAPQFKKIAGDLVEERLVPAPVGADSSKAALRQRMPPVVASEWKGYFDYFVSFYQLEPQQRLDAEGKFNQKQDQLVNWLLLGKRKVMRTSPWGPPVPVEVTTEERVKEYQNKRDRAAQIETKELPIFGADVNARLGAAKAEAAQVRGELLGNPAKTAEWLKQLDTLEKAVLDRKKQVDDLAVQIRKTDEELHKLKQSADKDDKAPADQLAKLNKNLTQLQARDKEAKTDLAALQDKYQPLINDLDLNKQTALMRRALRGVLNPEQLKREPPPDRPPQDWNVRAWSRLDWSDNLVKYGLTAVGFCLIAGLFTRTACVAGAGFLLLFVLAMPPLPGLPDNPKVEGHYLFVNKNLIMVLALLALATTRSGRWLGLDGLVQFLNPRRWRAQTATTKENQTEACPAPAQGKHTNGEDLTPVAASPDNGSHAVSAPTPKEPSDGH
ncbi:hypothetical protein AYO44_14015 [Planctomycetaceae bacterium SCGC AG-212-F19]|nr:hypothetical protein AYO44_14015 [Planctomycetaceae bacterium SCGC AG-212-F19]